MRDLYQFLEAMVRLFFLCSEKRGIGQKRHLVYLRLFKTIFWGETHCEKGPYHSLKIDLECHGKMHELEERRTEDSMRRKALERMDVEVIELTYDEVKDPKLFQATVKHLAKKLSLRLRSKNESHFAAHEEALRSQLFPEHIQAEQLWNETGSTAEEFESWEGEELPSEFDSWEVYMADSDGAGR